MIRVEVAVAAPLEQTLTYELQDSDQDGSAWSEGHSPVGRRVQVPLGGRSVTGYILAIVPFEEVDYTIRQITRLLDVMPLFHENLLPFFRWAASYYHYPLGQVIKAALPAGLAPKSGRMISLVQGNEAAFSSSFSGGLPDWAIELADLGKLAPVVSREVLARSKDRKKISQLESAGLIEVQEVAGQDRVRQKLETCYSLGRQLRNAWLTAGSDATNFGGCLSKWQAAENRKLKRSEITTLTTLASLVDETNCQDVPKRDLLRRYSGAAKALEALLGSSLIETSERRVFRNPFGEQVVFQPPPASLTDEQLQVLARIIPAIESGSYQTFLLHGITGCGKTEVYLRAAEKTLALGRDVLVLVPEIALATQLESHFISRFSEQVVLLHSGLTASERYDQWSLALAGQARIVIGARSALFAPLRDPGLIVVDEEHDGGFKQDDSFRYNGRDLAVLRGRTHDAVVLLGSATPSVTSYYHAERGKYTLLSMTKRVGESELPAVSIVDLSKKAADGAKGLFRRELSQALLENLTRGQQSILLLNRRGFSSVMLCQDCGAPVECLHCHVSLTLHKSRKLLICHYCGYSIGQAVVCGKCRSTETLVPVGFGTERVEEEARALLPDARIARLDSDTASDRKAFLKILHAMREREIDVLIGTQMIAKGHHFPHVTLVGVVWADGGLSMPDFRAAEKTFQLITQVTGRAGRGVEPGRVIIQTMRPEHYAIRFAQLHQYDQLYKQEMQARRNPAFPPFVRLIAFHLQGEKEADVRKTAAAVAACCRLEVKQRAARIEILGPAPAPLDKLKNNYRWQVLLKGADLEELHLICRQVEGRRQEMQQGGSRIVVDVDPENMM